MKNNSRISKRRYIIVLTLFSIAEMLGIYSILPIVVYVQRYERSLLLIVLCTLLVSSIEFMLNYQKNRKYINILLALDPFPKVNWYNGGLASYR